MKLCIIELWYRNNFSSLLLRLLSVAYCYLQLYEEEQTGLHVTIWQGAKILLKYYYLHYTHSVAHSTHVWGKRYFCINSRNLLENSHINIEVNKRFLDISRIKNKRDRRNDVPSVFFFMRFRNQAFRDASSLFGVPLVVYRLPISLQLVRPAGGFLSTTAKIVGFHPVRRRCDRQISRETIPPRLIKSRGRASATDACAVLF